MSITTPLHGRDQKNLLCAAAQNNLCSNALKWKADIGILRLSNKSNANGHSNGAEIKVIVVSVFI